MTMIPSDLKHALAKAIWTYEVGDNQPLPYEEAAPIEREIAEGALDAALLAAQDLGWVMRRESDFSSGQSWQPIAKLEPPKKDGVIIYYGERAGKLNVGLAYPTVSGPWRDSEPGYWSVPLYVTHWMPLPPPPV